MLAPRMRPLLTFANTLTNTFLSPATAVPTVPVQQPEHVDVLVNAPVPVQVPDPPPPPVPVQQPDRMEETF